MNNSDNEGQSMHLDVKLDEPLLDREYSGKRGIIKDTATMMNEQMSLEYTQNPSNLQNSFGGLVTTICTTNQE